MRNGLVLLVLALVVSAVAVVELRQRNRTLFAELQRLHNERDALNTEWGRLLLEEGAWSQHRRIEASARARLGMDLPDARRVVVVPVAGGKP
jgi:cell division protein FtsL